LLPEAVVEWKDVRASEYNGRDLRLFLASAYDYAVRNGCDHGFPNFHQADYGDGLVYGTLLVRSGKCEWRDVPAA
jgi:hypothetical protein